jgi:hypothetical protein
MSDDPFRNMPQIPADLGNNLLKGVGQGLDNFMNGLIDRVGELGGAAVTAVAAKSFDVAASVGGAAINAGTAPFQDGFIPSLSPGGAEVEAPRTQTREPAVERGFSELGGLSPDATPSTGIAAGQSVYR